jgi:hypothetical protein
VTPAFGRMVTLWAWVAAIGRDGTMDGDHAPVDKTTCVAGRVSMRVGSSIHSLHGDGSSLHQLKTSLLCEFKHACGE